METTRYKDENGGCKVLILLVLFCLIVFTGCAPDDDDDDQFSDSLISGFKPVTTSSAENNSCAAANVNDGDMSSRWASQEGNDPEWITIDLEQNASVSRVVLEWESAYASEYEIQTSADGINWTTVFSESNGNGGTDGINLVADGRYVRMYGIKRATEWGYSLYEFKIYGTFQDSAASRIILFSSLSVIETGGKTTIVTASVTDADGKGIPTATNPIEFILSGPGTIVGENPVEAADGKAEIVFQSGSQTGAAIITASSSGVASGKATVLVQKSLSNEDLRAYQHGIDFIPVGNDSYRLIWASSGNPPTGSDSSGNWTHDIFYSTINAFNPPEFPQNNAVNIISRDEAQEPASSAITEDGTIMITMEDGYKAPNWVAQRYGVYGSDFTNNPRPYDDVNTSVYEGGHSGHVAAAGNTFVVFWSDDWHGPDDSPPGPPGADGIGVGRHVLVDTYTSAGTHIKSTPVAVGDTSYDWWPVIAASENKACLVWQRYVTGDKYSKLMFAIYNPADNTFTKPVTELQDFTRYYTYDVQYYEGIDRFMIIGTYYNGGGFAHLIDAEGTIIDSLTTLPTGIRESQPAISISAEGVLAVYPTAPNGLISFKLTAQRLSIHEQISHDYRWEYIGNDAVFIDNNTIYVAALSSVGLRTFRIDVTPLDKIVSINH